MEEQKLLSEASFPSFPGVVTELLQYTAKNEACAKGAEEIIKKDPALTAEILKLANSPLYGKGRINSISHAVAFLGLKTLKYLAVTVAVTGVFSKMELLANQAGFDFVDFWLHSLRIAAIAQQVARKINYQDPEEAFVAGLLHDLGRLILVRNFPQKYAKVIQTIGIAKTKSFESTEKEIIGITHSEIGAKLLDFWNLPSLYSEVAKSHHQPLIKLKTTLAQVVYIAHTLQSIYLLPPSNKSFAIEMALREIKQLWELEYEDLEEILRTAELQVELIAQHLGISVETETKIKTSFSEQAEVLAKLLIFQNIWSDLKDLSFKDIFTQAAKALALAFGVKKLLCFVVDKEDNILNEVTIEPQRKAITLKKGDLVWEAIRQKRIVSISELKKKGFSTTEAIENYFKSNFIIMPLWSGEEILGVMLLDISTLNKKISSLLNFVAEQIATKMKIYLLSKERESLIRDRQRITEAYRNNLQKLINLEKKLAAIETAGALSHKLNQSLTVMRARVELLLEKIKNKEVEPVVRKELEVVLNESEKMSEFVKKILDLKEYKTKPYLDDVEILDVE